MFTKVKMDVYERRVQEIGSSHLITLPKKWSDLFALEKGSPVFIQVLENGQLLLSAQSIKRKEKSVSRIVCDEHFMRRFFKAYFQGNETIIVEQVEARKKIVYAMLEMFMNVQVMNEDAQSITLKTFKIEEISIEDCLQRMFSISLVMFDELKENLFEKDKTIAKFYYLLVMQIRRYLEEGKFAQSNMSILKAMDYRMIGEKIERIADECKMFGKVEDELKEYIPLAKEFYRNAVTQLIQNNFDKALPLFKKGSRLLEKLESVEKQSEKNKNIALYKQVCRLQRIIELSRSISLFVR